MKLGSRITTIRLAPLLLIAALSCTPEGETLPQGDALSVGEALGGDTRGYARAVGPRSFDFPQDHGAHPDFRTEWWYFTGNLEDGEGHRFGYQFTIFRQALAATVEQRDSRWATRDLWFAHFAVGHESAGRFIAFEQFERGAVQLAGATATPFAAWVGPWRVESLQQGETFPLRLRAERDELSIDLELQLDKPIVLQGDAGWSRKGSDEGNASYYYSATRLGSSGTLRFGEQSYRVTGRSWLDREWSTSVLSKHQTGWDWFAIQLDDGCDLMLYQLRRADGGVDPFNSGTVIFADGSTQRLQSDEIRFTPQRRWGDYTVEWQLEILPLGLTIDVKPMLDNSELPLSVRYWEGAIRTDPPGVGFLEMTAVQP